ncbi:VOC family protein [Gammaproteobacteria bacterium]|nr:VOC family protein [Gammaproteobacteria bacterium]MDA7786580.1 VOC family protein [Gammaproteobacteria bacterium]MDA7856626.1 VOC family protein [Gammaproteobacteria bacterium]MDA8696437.1 VOC family protein [Gammaproteobacteria bacterium]MDA8856833.1 VOC family protein [Gammaproteobacteria bacterium]|tara:strand:- start:2709 stop:3548 length:840 start_codon:yes stop_codon:yes gene_type:complete
MITTLDHLIVAVDDLDKAEKDYSKIFGAQPVWKGEHKELGTTNSLFNFQNTYFELLSASGEGLGAMLVQQALEETGEGLIGMVLGTDNIEETTQTLKNKSFLINDAGEGVGTNFINDEVRKWKNLFLPPELTRGIFSFIIQHTHGALPKHDKKNPSTINKLDHLVINTNDADGFIEIYKDIFGIRLALDKHIEHWDKRMLFFRLNQTTLEVVEKKDDLASHDSLWGLAWDVIDIEKVHKRLSTQGIDISSIKDGIKENTRVATIKSHTHGVPTLLIEHI